MKSFVDMVNTDSFLFDVIAYPAIVVIAREKPDPTRIAARPAINAGQLQSLAKAMTARKLGKDRRVSEVAHATGGAEPWMLKAPGQLDILRRIEAECPTIEKAGCKVGIGVATGTDQVFIGPFDQLDVESDRKLPLVMTRGGEGRGRPKIGTTKWKPRARRNFLRRSGRCLRYAARQHRHREDSLLAGFRPAQLE